MNALQLKFQAQAEVVKRVKGDRVTVEQVRDLRQPPPEAEIPLLGVLDMGTRYECPICHAAVDEFSRRGALEWHLAFHGFQVEEVAHSGGWLGTLLTAIFGPVMAFTQDGQRVEILRVGP